MNDEDVDEVEEEKDPLVEVLLQTGFLLSLLRISEEETRVGDA